MIVFVSDNPIGSRQISVLAPALGRDPHQKSEFRWRDQHLDHHRRCRRWPSPTHPHRRHSLESKTLLLLFCYVKGRLQLQALVYDILPSTTAVFSYAIGSRKLSANEQFFVGAQTVVSLLQTTQIKQGASFIAANKVYTSTNKTTIVWIETELSFFYPGWMRLMFTCALWR